MTAFAVVALVLLSAAPSSDAPDAGSTDVVRELVRASLPPEGVGGEVLEPDHVYFGDPRQPRFVTVDLQLRPTVARGGWQPVTTSIGGLSHLQFVIDRLHSRLVTGPDGSLLQARVAELQASRARALAVARSSMGAAAAQVTHVSATFTGSSGGRDVWSFTVSGGDAGVREVRVETGSWVVLPQGPASESR